MTACPQPPQTKTTNVYPQTGTAGDPITKAQFVAFAQACNLLDADGNPISDDVQITVGPIAGLDYTGTGAEGAPADARVITILNPDGTVLSAGCLPDDAIATVECTTDNKAIKRTFTSVKGVVTDECHNASFDGGPNSNTAVIEIGPGDEGLIGQTLTRSFTVPKCGGRFVAFVNPGARGFGAKSSADNGRIAFRSVYSIGGGVPASPMNGNGDTVVAPDLESGDTESTPTYMLITSTQPGGSTFVFTVDQEITVNSLTAGSSVEFYAASMVILFIRERKCAQ